jgi:diaminohydroxyphosphoribosylaminopyrimidine deaminase/5-amino-6-(5-phosphoribosylamino)uracil reductase
VHEFFMRIALKQAEKGLGRTSPNPAVGAVITQGGRVVARGFHAKAGAPHAEVLAIRAAGPRARGGDLYTTLEPCNHQGRTPPCTDAILEAGIRRVICASHDPNPLVDGKGIARLRRAGVQVITGILEEQADSLNRPFLKAMRTGLPWVTLKAAVTLDGKIATATGDSRWVTGEDARAMVHRLRDRVDAILVGANTVVRDDPRLTTRLPRGKGKNPVRIVVDSRLRLSPDRAVFREIEARTIVATTAPLSSPKARRLASRGIELWPAPKRGGQVDLRAVMRRAAREGLQHVLVEGGAQVFASALRERLADELWLFLAPKILGDGGLSWAGHLGIREMRQALAVGHLSVEHVGEDLLVRALLANR